MFIYFYIPAAKYAKLKTIRLDECEQSALRFSCILIFAVGEAGAADQICGAVDCSSVTSYATVGHHFTLNFPLTRQSAVLTTNSQPLHNTQVYCPIHCTSPLISKQS